MINFIRDPLALIAALMVLMAGVEVAMVRWLA